MLKVHAIAQELFELGKRRIDKEYIVSHVDMSHAGSDIVTELPSLRKELEEFHQFWSIAGIE